MNDAEAKLVAALRSGRYAQTTGALRQADSYCCLGVACDVLSGPAGWTSKEGIWYYGASASVLPDSVREALGWLTPAGSVRSLVPSSLLDANDSGETFAQIADRIERGEVRHAKDLPK